MLRRPQKGLRCKKLTKAMREECGTDLAIQDLGLGSNKDAQSEELLDKRDMAFVLYFIPMQTWL